MRNTSRKKYAIVIDVKIIYLPIGKKIKNLKLKNQKGFTLIEILVVTSLTVILMMSATALFLNFMASSSRTNYIQEVKAEGKTVMEHVTFLLRNTKNVKVCNTGLTEITFTNLDNYNTTLKMEDDRIASTSTATDTFYLSSVATSVSNLNFDCYKNNMEKGQYVQVTFNLSLGDTDDDDPLGSFTQNFSQGVLLRNTSF